MQSSRVQTFYVLPPAGRPLRRQVFCCEWNRDLDRCLERVSADFSSAQSTLAFQSEYKKSERICWAADHPFDARAHNPRAQAMLPEWHTEVIRGDLIVEMTRHIWPTYWVSASVSEMEDAVENLTLERVAIMPEWRKRGGCFVATPDNKGRSIVMQTLILAAP
tara:strand:+ start:2496 stop:2984 length:489 start_codon:yes stop_codon:yes gene_type:complete